MNTYNKEEVMKAWREKFSNPDTFSSKGLIHQDYENGGLGRMMMDMESFLSTALDAAYKAGREEMYLAGGKACKKVYQNHKEDHLCRFNDGEQNCNCYLSGINEVIVALEALK